MAERPKLLFLVAEDFYFLSHRLDLARAAREAGAEVVVATGPGSRGAEIEAEGFRHLTLPLSRKSLNPAREARSLAAVVRLLRAERPEIAHLVAVKPILYGSLAARLVGEKKVGGVVCAVAGLGYLSLGQGAKAGLLWRLARAVYRSSVAPRGNVRVIVQNPDDRGVLVESGMADLARTRVITGSGVDLDRFIPREKPSDTVRIVTHARMLRDKGIAEVVEAAGMLHAKGLDFELLLVGDPDPHNPASLDQPWLERASQNPGVRWLGRRDDIPDILGRAHIACLPSYREGAPLSLIEAAACGLPLVASDAPGCREVVVHGENGLLVPARDATSLALALERLIHDEELRQRMGAKSRDLAEEKLSRERVIADTFAVYRELTGGRWPA